MIKANFSAYSTYITDSLHQWDINQTLEVTGLNLTTAPEVHFSNSNSDRAIVRQATLSRQVIKVGIPNSLLQEPHRIFAHIGVYEGDTFKVVEVAEIPVKPRKRPADYQLTDTDEEVYSFKRLENMLANKADAQTINARVDNILAHNNDTDGNSELVDIRTGADGESYDSAGAAVRMQFADLQRHQSKENLINLNTLSAGYLSDTDAATNTVLGEDCYYSDYIAVNSALPYYLKINNVLDYTSPWLAVNTYDSSKKFIERIAEYKGERLFKFEAAVAFVRISFRGLFLHAVKFEQSTYPTPVQRAESLNLHDIYPLTLPGYVDSGGTIHAPTEEGYLGVAGASAAEKHSRVLPVAPGEVYVFYNGVKSYPWGSVGFYSASGHFVKRETFTTDGRSCTEITVPDGAVAMRYSARTYSQFAFVVYKKTEGENYIAAYVDQLIAKTAAPPVVSHIVKAVAHRGFSAAAPENTLPAYRLAKRRGFDYAECDVSFTSNGAAVLLHDSTVDRTSNGSGNIASLTYGEVKALDFGSWKGEEYIGTTIPTFEEFLALCRAIGLKPYVEVKTGTEQQVKGLVDAVIRYGLRDKTTWISFSASCLDYIKDADDKARLGYVVDTIDEGTIATAQSLQTGKNEVFIDCSAGNAAAGVDLCITARIPLEVWTVNDEATVKNLPDYVSGITSDKLIAGDILFRANI